MGQLVALVAVVAVVVAGALTSSIPLHPVPAVGLLHAVMGAFISGLTALLMFEHARATRKRGFLLVGVTFLYLACIPLAFPGAIIEEGNLLGTPQTPVGLFFAWHFAVPLGLGVATVVLYADERRHRRPDLTPALIRIGGIITVALAGLAFLIVLEWPISLFPELIDATGRLTAYSETVKAVALLVTVAFLLVALFCARTGSVISGWLAATAVLTVGEAVVSFTSNQRYTLGWYFSRLLWLVALSVLLIALIRSLSRVAAANVALGAVDSITGAASRSAFLLTMNRELARSEMYGEQVGLLWVNVDRFKDINDQLGHEIGDAVLRRVVARMRRHVGGAEMVGRLGGDEFGILLTEADAVDVSAVADALLQDIRRPIELGEVVMHVTAALGSATSPRDARDADQLLRCADLAMDAAKQASGDRCQAFEPRMASEALTRTQIRRQLGEALLNEEFLLYYQPIFGLADGRIAGAEALARWRHDDQIRPAGQWIPVAEASGQIVAISGQLVGCLVHDVPRLIAHHGDGFFVTFNLSTRELADVRLVDTIVERLRPFASHVLLELTESMELEESSEVAHNLDRLRSIGLRVAVDDYGAGYSNLTRLERLRPAILKTDRTLVSRAGSDLPEGAAFLRAAAALASSLGCDMVVEGVETQAEESAVQAAAARYVQGFRYARPAPVEELLATPGPP